MQIIEAEKVIANDPKHARATYAPAYEKGSAYTQDTYRPIVSGQFEASLPSA